MVLQPNPNDLKGAELQYLTQPVDRGGAVSEGEKKADFFLISDNPFKCIRKCLYDLEDEVVTEQYGSPATRLSYSE